MSKRSPSPPTELPAFDPRPSARFGYEVLTKLNVPFALIGKVAMWTLLPDEAHDLTKDVDFAIQPRSREPLRAELLRRGMTPKPLSIGGLAVRHDEIRVDFIDRSEGGLDSLYQEAISDAAEHGERASVGDSTVPVVRAEYLVAMKLVTGEDRDEADAVRLLGALHDLDLKMARSIVLRHGGPAGANRLDALARRAGRPDARPTYRNSG